MSKKQIIIDGVDVKDCKRRIGKDNYCRYYKRPCSENNFNCIWKKYLRKEQECEKFKTQILSLQTMEIEELEKLKQEKAEIKKYLGISDKSIMQRLEELQEFKDELKISEDRYKQVLNEIEKYLDAQQKYFDGEDYHNLLDIINKAKEGNNNG